MKIEVSITKQHIVSMVLAVAIVAGIGYAIAQTSAPNPGHSPSEIGPGTFAGSSSDTWIFPGNVDVVGGISANAFYYSSDIRLKKNIQEIPDVLERIQMLEGVSFRWKEDDKQSIGLIAQDLEKVFPELVSTDENTGLKSIQYGNLVAALIEAIKQQQMQIQELREEVEGLKRAK